MSARVQLIWDFLKADSDITAFKAPVADILHIKFEYFHVKIDQISIHHHLSYFSSVL